MGLDSPLRFRFRNAVISSVPGVTEGMKARVYRVHFQYMCTPYFCTVQGCPRFPWYFLLEHVYLALAHSLMKNFVTCVSSLDYHSFYILHFLYRLFLIESGSLQGKKVLIRTCSTMITHGSPVDEVFAYVTHSLDEVVTRLIPSACVLPCSCCRLEWFTRYTILPTRAISLAIIYVE